MKKIIKFLKRILSKPAYEKFYASKSHKDDVTVKIDGVDVKVGKFTYGVGNISLAYHSGSPRLEIGRFCSIAGNVTIFTGAYHRIDWLSTYPFGHIHEEIFGYEKTEGYPHSKGGVIIGNDVWLGTGCTIMSGVTIGDGVVVAACSVVTKNIPPYTIVAGNPAKQIRKRFDDVVINKLLELKWWDKTESEINEISDILCSNDIEKLNNI